MGRLWSGLINGICLYCLKNMFILVNVVFEFQCRAGFAYFLYVTRTCNAGNQLIKIKT